MDNELEIVKNDGITASEVAKTGINKQYIAMAGGGLAMLVAGALFYKFVLDPAIAKHKAKKAAKAEAPKSES